ncbi:protein THEM6 [Neodiprion pinetum]|uniref:Protein THEM6 n=1 Tax=Neodiprion lecontei TaxID=441921 RepID=A0A6J0CG63_NEOLC|nr:protein THEM6 [Neodiprion lecontei]XP_046421129.1 protein THEM6-like [Neodiprion fabricii]XP_046421130.1 protein THEM6-like [Neodiprion fabricii]XP_046476737.1 protein THEM6-like [Neodiprion pinetum]XP_046476739.1 protein THEM6-like [Neodiprion pinetum]XP_046592727.1 protein THEM6 [Neodiprion lecontei]XP_046615856.1 protein THEM6-like [Neodiprion virginianus]XP_046615857.1 protein THEM6-like [Neodiprion virginianus]
MFCYCTVAIVAILYMLFDVNYFLRIAFTLSWGRLFQKKKKLFEETTIHGICTTQDVDLFFRNMNIARYVRELDFARFHYYDRSGVYGAIHAKGGSAVQSAASVRYRRALPIFTPYKVTTKLIYWDDKNFYLEQQLISLPDNFIRTIVLSKQSVTGLKIPVSEIIAKVEEGAKRPELSKDLRLWLESMEESSQKLKKQN